jgi:hypothetical protein
VPQPVDYSIVSGRDTSINQNIKVNSCKPPTSFTYLTMKENRNSEQCLMAKHQNVDESKLFAEAVINNCKDYNWTFI